MRFVRATLTLVSIITLMLVVSASAMGANPAWPVARQATLPTGATGLGQGYLPALSCPTFGNCVAAGVYTGAHGLAHGLLLNEVAGAWKRPTTIAPPLDAARDAGVTPYGLSCAAPGSCAAVGSYQDRNGSTQGFVVEEQNFVWRRARQVPLPTNAVAKGQNTQIRSVICPAPGYCSAVGTYLNNSLPVPPTQGLLIDEVAGVWRRSVPVTLPPGASFDPYVQLAELACSSVGNCSATGSYLDANNLTHGLIVNETGGQWSRAIAISPPANVSAFPLVLLSSLTCPQAGYCTAIGTYETSLGRLDGFTITERRNVWGTAIAMRMPVASRTNPHAFLYGFSALSCPSVTECSAGGQYRDSAGHYQGFFINEVHGVWGTASEMTLPAGASMAGKNGGVVAVSCASRGICSAGAAYLDASNRYQALVVNEVDGVWRTGTKVDLPARATNVGVNGGVYGLTCDTKDRCTAVGSFLATRTNYEGFTLATQ